VLGTAAYLLGWGTGRAGNYGELLEPKPLALAPLQGLRGKWVLLSADASACAPACERKLYFMRQVRRAQGKNMDRVERLWIITDAGKPRPELLAAFEGTHLGWVSDPPLVPEHIYLVDPLGNLMMRFPRDPDPSRMLKDLQRLLKYSKIG
jgi:hypothetical protein